MEKVIEDLSKQDLQILLFGGGKKEIHLLEQIEGKFKKGGFKYIHNT